MTPQDAQNLIQALLDVGALAVVVLLAAAAYLTMRAGR